MIDRMFMLITNHVDPVNPVKIFFEWVADAKWFAFFDSTTTERGRVAR